MGQLINTITDQNIVVIPGEFNPDDEATWKWMVGSEAPDEDKMSPEGGVATMQGYLYDHSQLQNAVALFVGYSWVDYSVTPPQIRRSLPVYHPRWPFLRCESATVKGLRPNGQIAGPLNTYGKLQGQRALPVPVYHEYRFALEFRQPSYEIKADEQIIDLTTGLQNEWQRYLFVSEFDDTELVVVDGGQYVYNLPSFPTWGTKSPVVSNGPSQKVYVQRQGLLVTAYQIPADFVTDANGIMTTFVSMKGKVNSAPFLGKPIDTMLFKNYKVTKVAQPITTNVLNGLSYNLKIEMMFSYTEPDRLEPTETRAGWQLVPPPGGGNVGGWVGVLPRSALTGVVDTNGLLYPRVDFNNLLTYRT